MKQDFDYFEHPLFRRHGTLLETPMILDLADTLRQFLWRDSVGCYFLGSHRIGKSWAIRWLCNVLVSATNKKVFCHRFSVSRRSVKTVEVLYSALCRTTGIDVKHGASPDDMFSDIFTYFTDQMAIRGSDQAILFVDEMDRLGLDQIDALADLFDFFDSEKVDLRIVFIGNTGPGKELIERIKESQNDKSYSRFFETSYRLYGIKSKNNLQACLSYYDTERFPTPDGPTYTEYFLGDKFPKGWKLSSLATPIWKVFRRDFGRPFKLDSWGMQYFATTIKTLIVHYLSVDGLPSSKNALEEMIHKSIKSSHLVRKLVTDYPK